MGRRVLVGFRATNGPGSRHARAEAVRQGGGAVHRSLDIVPVVSATLSEQAIRTFKTRSDVEYVEDDVVLKALGQSTPWGVDRIDADLAWPAGNTGAGVRVAILDTGIDADHPDLAVAGGVNYAGSTSDGSTNPSAWNDNHGHGTHCAGIIAARNNSIGVVGVAPGAQLWAVKVLGDDGSGYTSDVIQGLDWCAANGVHVASMSLGGRGTTSLKNACSRAYAAGVLLVAAAGNESGAVSYPAAYTSVVAVSATDSADRLASFSNYGRQIALAAPGVSIYSTYKNAGYATMSGTSMACPHVAGAAALAWASGLGSNTAVLEWLLSTAEDLGARGFDVRYGYGLVDAQQAAGKSAAPTDEAPSVEIVSPSQGGTVSGTVTVAATASDDDGVVRVEFLVDGVSIGVDTQIADGWSAPWNSTGAGDGQHTIVAEATDTAGQTATDTITVIADNADEAPTVEITSPLDAATVSGEISLVAMADDDEGVAKVTFLVDGDTLAVDTSSADGWSAKWDTTSVANGSHTLVAVVTDAGGQTASDSVVVTVNNTTPTTGSTVSVVSITYSLGGSFWSANDLVVMLEVQDDLGNAVPDAFVAICVYRNGRVYRTLSGTTDSEGSLTFQIANAPSGSYRTRVIQVDAGGWDWDGQTPWNAFRK
ncbi:MAG TPA: S8 family serine peptidase [Sedimentisphaerales bacterium]|nr:S8 family serine peptidase [Sedimentisphaerales bacterium]HNU29464.1 S8 family serine peptidase [Sedimentisphaerales bacterium]